MNIYSWLERQNRVKEVWKQWKKIKRKKKKRNKIRGKPSGLFGIQYMLCTDFMGSYNNKSCDEKIRRLKELSELKFKNHQPYKERRKKSHWVQPSKRCWVCKDRAEVVHHIIQIQFGGYDNGINRIRLCNSCHEKIHDWLFTERIDKMNDELDREVRNIVYA